MSGSKPEEIMKRLHQQKHKSEVLGKQMTIERESYALAALKGDSAAMDAHRAKLHMLIDEMLDDTAVVYTMTKAYYDQLGN